MVLLDGKKLIEKRSGDTIISLVEIRPPGCETVVYKLELDECNGFVDSCYFPVWFENFDVAMQVLETIYRYGIFDEDQALRKKFTTAQIKEKTKLERICSA